MKALFVRLLLATRHRQPRGRCARASRRHEYAPRIPITPLKVWAILKEKGGSLAAIMQAVLPKATTNPVRPAAAD
jgi:hypothetical protein